MRLRLTSAREYEQKQRLSVVKGKTTDLPAGSAVDDVNELVAPPISGGFECRDAIAEVLFVAVLRPKDEFANARVEPIGADDEVKPPFGAMLELDMYLAARLAQSGNAVPKNDLTRSAYLVANELREIAAPYGDISPAGELTEQLHTKPR